MSGAQLDSELTKKEVLKEYKDLINSIQFNRLDLKINQIIWKIIFHKNLLGKSVNSIKVRPIVNAEDFSNGDLVILLDKFNSLIDAKKSLGSVGKENPFWGFEPKSLSHQEVEAIKNIFLQLIDHAKDIQPLFQFLNEKIVSSDPDEIDFKNISLLSKSLSDLSKIKLGVDKELFSYIWQESISEDTDYQLEIDSLDSDLLNVESLNLKFKDILKPEVKSSDDFSSLVEVYKKFSQDNAFDFLTLEALSSNPSKLSTDLDAFESTLVDLNEFLS
jgi:ribosomal protein S18